MPCCPNCGSADALGTEMASVCADCGQAAILGMSVPVASVLGAMVLVAAVGLALAALRSWRRSAPALLPLPA